MALPRPKLPVGFIAAHTLAYRSWMAMRNRCLNPNAEDWKDYGGRGITVCARWALSFEAFVADMGDRPSERHSIERINNDRGYYPENCKWATAHEQTRNKRSNVRFIWRGESYILADLCAKYALTPSMVMKRLKVERVSLSEALMPANGGTLVMDEHLPRYRIMHPSPESGFSVGLLEDLFPPTDETIDLEALERQARAHRPPNAHKHKVTIDWLEPTGLTDDALDRLVEAANDPRPTLDDYLEDQAAWGEYYNTDWRDDDMRFSC